MENNNNNSVFQTPIKLVSESVLIIYLKRYFNKRKKKIARVRKWWSDKRNEKAGAGKILHFDLMTTHIFLLKSLLFSNSLPAHCFLFNSSAPAERLPLLKLHPENFLFATILLGDFPLFFNF